MARRRRKDCAELATIHLLRPDGPILEGAAALEPVSIRCLDAVHLASALALGEQLGALLTYDRRMIAAAVAIGIEVSSPG